MNDNETFAGRKLIFHASDLNNTSQAQTQPEPIIMCPIIEYQASAPAAFPLAEYQPIHCGFVGFWSLGFAVFVAVVVRLLVAVLLTRAEEKRVTEEKRRAEEKRLAEEKRIEEEKRIKEEKRADWFIRWENAGQEERWIGKRPFWQYIPSGRNTTFTKAIDIFTHVTYGGKMMRVSRFELCPLELLLVEGVDNGYIDCKDKDNYRQCSVQGKLYDVDYHEHGCLEEHIAQQCATIKYTRSPTH